MASPTKGVEDNGGKGIPCVDVPTSNSSSQSQEGGQPALLPPPTPRPLESYYEAIR